MACHKGNTLVRHLLEHVGPGRIQLGVDIAQILLGGLDAGVIGLHASGGKVVQLGHLEVVLLQGGLHFFNKALVNLLHGGGLFAGHSHASTHAGTHSHAHASAGAHASGAAPIAVLGRGNARKAKEDSKGKSRARSNDFGSLHDSSPLCFEWI